MGAENSPLLGSNPRIVQLVTSRYRPRYPGSHIEFKGRINYDSVVSLRLLTKRSVSYKLRSRVMNTEPASQPGELSLVYYKLK
jgi:hypothetical protein